MKLTIGITDCNKFKNYEDWLASEKVTVVKLSPKEKNLTDIDKCDGIVLSGGEDVHPKYYGHPEWMTRKEELKLDVNEERDEFEMKVIDQAYKKKIPILGICRGLQIANVYFKGTLIPDIRAESLKQHSKESDADKTHTLKVEEDSCLNGIILNHSGNVNSAHHQAADKIGEGLKVSARSQDGTVEAENIVEVLENEILKRDLQEGEKAIEAKKKIEKYFKNQVPKTRPTKEDTAGITSDATENAVQNDRVI